MPVLAAISSQLVHCTTVLTVYITEDHRMTTGQAAFDNTYPTYIHIWYTYNTGLKTTLNYFVTTAKHHNTIVTQNTQSNKLLNFTGQCSTFSRNFSIFPTSKVVFQDFFIKFQNLCATCLYINQTRYMLKLSH